MTSGDLGLVLTLTVGPLCWTICWAIVRFVSHKWPKERT